MSRFFIGVGWGMLILSSLIEAPKTTALTFIVGGVLSLTAEVTRMYTTGEPNTDSMLYAAAERAKAKGYRRWLTYLLASEWDRFDAATGRRTDGAGARSAGWQELWRVDGRSWDCKSRARVDKHPTEDKVAVGAGAWRCLAQAA